MLYWKCQCLLGVLLASLKWINSLILIFKFSDFKFQPVCWVPSVDHIPPSSVQKYLFYWENKTKKEWDWCLTYFFGLTHSYLLITDKERSKTQNFGHSFLKHNCSTYKKKKKKRSEVLTSSFHTASSIFRVLNCCTL